MTDTTQVQDPEFVSQPEQVPQQEAPFSDSLPDMTDEERKASETGNEEPWDFPDVGTMEEEKKKRIRLFKPTIFFMKLRDVKMTVSKFQNQYTGNYDTNIVWEWDIVKNIDGTPIMLSNGMQAQKSEKTGTFTTVTFSNKDAVSQAKDGTPQETRAIMCALLNQEGNASLKGVKPGLLVGKGVRVTVEIGKKKDGSPKQLWKSWAPWNLQ